ncbi:MAG: hypothetical protein ABH817_00415 [archaeon]
MIHNHGFVSTTPLLLKFYELIKKGDLRISGGVVEARRQFLLEKIASEEENRIISGIGLGFAILSSGGNALNVSTWGTNPRYPHVATSRYFVAEDTPERMVELDIRKEGDHCVWEYRVAQHESGLLIAYLGSGRTEEDKRTFFENFLEGELYP